MRPLRLVLFGDGESPHLLKWARALAPRVELHVASSRGLASALAALVPPERALLLAPNLRDLIASTEHFYARLLRLDRSWRETERMQPSAIDRLRERLAQSAA